VLKTLISAISAFTLLAFAATETSSGNGAVVIAESVSVYSETAGSSAILKQLTKGAALTVDYSIMTSEGEWCSLGAPEHGYVLCSFLKREEPPKQDTAPASIPAVLASTTTPAAPADSAVHKPPAFDPATFTPEQSALMSAAKVGSAAGVELALSKGATVNGRDKDGKTALMWAAYMGRNEAIKALLAAGADVNSADNLGWTPVEAAVWARHSAALELLLEASADVNVRDSEGRTPLMHAAQYGDLVAMRDLLAKGADPNARNRFAQTPLMFAVALPEPDAAELLVSAGADVNARDAAGRSVMTNAVLTGADRPATLELLLRAHADLNTKDNENRTALFWALKNRRNSFAQWLKKAGAVEW